jgi:hypothetical protein
MHDGGLDSGGRWSDGLLHRPAMQRVVWIKGSCRQRKDGRMNSSRSTRILLVANRTAAAPRLLDEIGRRAKSRACEFTLLIPNAPDRKAADWTLATALPLLQRAARGSVDSMVGGPDPFESVETAVRDGEFDEIIVSTLPRGMSKWSRRDLISRLRRLGLPVTAVVPSREQYLSSEDTDKAVTQTPPGLGGP